MIGRTVIFNPTDITVITDRGKEAMFIVTENTPGYMPDSDDPFVTDDYKEAVDYANELADQLEDEGYSCDRSWASNNNLYAIHCERSDTVAPDLGRTIAVELIGD